MLAKNTMVPLELAMALALFPQINAPTVVDCATCEAMAMRIKSNNKNLLTFILNVYFLYCINR